MTTILTIIITILVLSFLVFIHELGHFIAAKLSGVRVREFSIGFGKSIFQKNYRGTKYKIGLVPLGGYVQLEGEAQNTGPDSFRAKKYPAKLFILFAGVMMNLLYTIIVFSIFLAATGYQFALPKFSNFNFTNTKEVVTAFPITVFDIDQSLMIANYLEEEENIIGINGQRFNSIEEFDSMVAEANDEEVAVEFLDLETFKSYSKNVRFEELEVAPLVITAISEESPVKENFEIGDRIISINETDIDSAEKLNETLEKNEGQSVSVLVKDKDGLERTELIKVELQNISEDGIKIYLNVALSQYKYGFALTYDNQTNKETYFISYNPNLLAGSSLTYDVFRYQFAALGSIITDARESGDYSEVANSVGGVPQLGDQVSQVVEFEAFVFLIPLSGLLSLALATFNVLPFPALDGGQAFAATIEFVTRKKIPDNILNIVNLVGFAFLIILAIIVTIKDIIQLGWI